ncbi:MAG: hypothetical protein JXR27_11245 [Paludibacteraceae bacterium]|nr:hypothetical protein [Paludibacteraceae bacterium]
MKSFNLKILVFFLTVVALNGCVSTSKMTKVIRDRMPSVAQPTYDYSSFVTVNSDSLIHTDSLVTVKKEKSYFIPAVFLWAWNHRLACELNSDYMLNIFRKVLADKLKEYNMEKFIGNNKLEINIKKVPNRFKYTNNGSVMFLVFAYSYHFQEVVYRENESFELTYVFTDDNGNQRGDSISYTFPVEYKTAGLSGYSYVQDYMVGLKYDFEMKTAEFVDRIIEGL